MSCVTSVTSGSVAIVLLAEARPRGPCSPAVDTHAAVAGGSVCAAAVGQLGFLCPPDPCAPHACLSCSFIPAGRPSDVLTGCCHPRHVSLCHSLLVSLTARIFSCFLIGGSQGCGQHGTRVGIDTSQVRVTGTSRFHPVSLLPPSPSPVFIYCTHLGGSDA